MRTVTFNGNVPISWSSIVSFKACGKMNKSNHFFSTVRINCFIKMWINCLTSDSLIENKWANNEIYWKLGFHVEK